MSLMIKVLDQWQEIERLNNGLKAVSASCTYFQTAYQGLVSSLRELVHAEDLGRAPGAWATPRDMQQFAQIQGAGLFRANVRTGGPAGLSDLLGGPWN